MSPELRARVAGAVALMGFLPQDVLVMARMPALLDAMAGLVGAVYGPGTLAPGLKRLVGEAASKAAGCQYCAAHAAHGAQRAGVDAAKIAAVWRFDDSPLFDEAERAAINLAMKAARTPSGADDADFARLRAHFTDDEILEIVAVIAMFGFLNRWNATLDTQLEPAPAATMAEVSRAPENG